MHLDATTLADLELLSDRGGGLGVLGYIDRTRTSAGHAALRRRLRNPLTTVAEIGAVQDALAHLAAAARPLRFSQKLLEGAQAYADSRVLVTTGSAAVARAREVWYRVRDPALVKELEAGQHALRALLGATRILTRRFTADAVPVVLMDLARQMAAHVEALETALARGPLLASDARIRTQHRDDIHALVGLVGELDALQTMATAGEELGWCRPELVSADSFLLEAEGAWHPFVEDVRPNPVRLTGGEPLVFLTGPNMAGKTTYLRTVALVTVLAQTGMRVPAAALRLAPVEAVLTSLSPTDNLREGISYFQAEILRVKEAAELVSSGAPALVLFDEVFKGTNVRDALDASTAVISGFARARRSGFIFSSHLTELARTLPPAVGRERAVRFCCFRGEIDGGRPVFDYALEEGVSEQRFGMLLLEAAGVPELMERVG